MIIPRTFTHGLLTLLCASALSCAADDMNSSVTSPAVASSIAEQTGLRLPTDRVAM